MTSRARLVDLSLRKRLIAWKISPLWMGKPSPIQLWKADDGDSPLGSFSILQLKLFASSFDSFKVSDEVSELLLAEIDDVWEQKLRMGRRSLGGKQEMLSVRRMPSKILCSPSTKAIALILG